MPSSFSPSYEHSRAGGPIRSVSRRSDKVLGPRRGLANGDNHIYKNKTSLSSVRGQNNNSGIDTDATASRSTRPRPYDRPDPNSVNHQTDDRTAPTESSKSLLSSLSDAVSKKLTSFFWIASSPSFDPQRDDIADIETNPSPSFLRRSTIALEEGRASNIDDKPLPHNSINQPHYVGETPYINRTSGVLSKNPASIKPDSSAPQPLQRTNPSLPGTDHQDQLQLARDSLNKGESSGFDLSGISWQPNDPVSIVKAYREVLRRKNRKNHVRTLRNQLNDTMRQRGYPQTSEGRQHHRGKHRKTPSVLSSRAISPTQTDHRASSREASVVPMNRQIAVAKPPSKPTTRKASARLQIMPIPDDDTSDAVLSLVRRRRQAENSPKVTKQQSANPRNTIQTEPSHHPPATSTPSESVNSSYVNSETQTDLDLKPPNGVSKPSLVTSTLSHNTLSLVPVNGFKPTKRKRALQLSDIPMDRAKRPGFFSVDSDDDYLEDDESSEDESNKKRRKVSDSLSVERRSFATNKTLNARPKEEDPEVLEKRKQLSTQKKPLDEGLENAKIPPSAGFNFAQVPESPTKEAQGTNESQTQKQPSALFSAKESNNGQSKLSFNLSEEKDRKPGVSNILFSSSALSDATAKGASEKPASGFQFGTLDHGAPREKGQEQPASLFGSSAQQPTMKGPETTAPSLSFGAPSSKRSRDSEPSEPRADLAFGKKTAESEKPAFSFGGEPKAKQTQEQQSKLAAPSFSFGSSPSKSPAETVEEQGQKKSGFAFGSSHSESKPGFSFGTTNTEKGNETEKDKLPSFGFGAPLPQSSDTLLENDKVQTKPTFGFTGSSLTSNVKPFSAFGTAQKAPSSHGPETLEQPKPAFGFGDTDKKESEPKEQSKPAFSFGSHSEPAKEQSKPAFSFGSNTEPAKEQSKPAFSFGSNSEPAKEQSKPAFSFGSNSEPAKEQSKPAFSFGRSELSQQGNTLPPVSGSQQPSSTPSFSKEDKKDDSPQPLSSGSAGSGSGTGTPIFNFSSAKSSTSPTTTQPSGLTSKPSNISGFGGFGKSDKSQEGTAAVTAPSKVNETEPNTSISFNQSTNPAPFGSSNTTEPAKPANAFSFGNASNGFQSEIKESNPASVFGSPSPSSTSGFGFGTGSQPTSSTNQTPSFGFGSSSQPASSGFNFGAPSTSTNMHNPSENKPTTGTFSFGGDSSNNNNNQAAGSTFNFGSNSTSAAPSFQFGSTATTSNPANIFGFQPTSNSGGSNSNGSVTPSTPGGSGFSSSAPDPNNPFSAGLVSTPPSNRKFAVPRSISNRNRRK